MNGDLINRETTVKMLREYAEVKFVCGQIELANGILKAVNYIEGDNIPVAYDAEKVCRKINENKDMDNLIDADHAIKIVKGGGLNG